MENKLIKTDTIWYKIKNFFRKIFFKQKKETPIYEAKEEQNIETKKEAFIEKIEYKKELEIQSKKEEMAEKLRQGEIGVNDLTETEVDEMTEYFIKDIQEIDKELLRIKEHIISMKKKLSNL